MTYVSVTVPERQCRISCRCLSAKVTKALMQIHLKESYILSASLQKRKSERAVLTTISISHHYLQERLYIKVCLHLTKLMNFTLTLKMWIWKRQSHLCTHVSQPTHSRLGKERIRTDTLSITAKLTLSAVM